MNYAGWIALLTTLAYFIALFSIAHFADTRGRNLLNGPLRPYIYSLSLGIYCTSWTFYGSVGQATAQGLSFLPIYIGPVLVFVFGRPLILRIIRLAKAQNTTSVADFLATRYGKSQSVAALVTVSAVAGIVPYIALQLKAITASVATVIGSLEAMQTVTLASAPSNLAITSACLLAGFAMAFGTRRVEATEHQNGLILAIAIESIVKLVTFVALGAYVTWGMFDGLGDIITRAAANPHIMAMLSSAPPLTNWLNVIVLSACAILFLPRQFHVTIVENRNEKDLDKAAWLFPAYLLAIILFVLPVAIASILVFPDGTIDRDMSVLALPLEAKSTFMAILTMIGGLSAATAMVVVSCVALAIMVSNDLVVPLLLRSARVRQRFSDRDAGGLILIVRRIAIMLILALAYGYYRIGTDAGLSSIGILSFVAIAQLAPAFLGGLVWSGATSRGALAGIGSGILVWVYTLLLPSLNPALFSLGGLIAHGPFGIEMLRPTALFGMEMDLLEHGTFWSLAVNILAYAGLSLTRVATPIERLQANIFVGRAGIPIGQSFRLWRSSVTARELENTVARYLGPERAQSSFREFLEGRGEHHAPDGEADIHLVRFAEHLLSSAIGAASSRLVLSLLMRRRNVSPKAALKLVDDASAALQYNRDILQHAIDFARQGITVFDRDLRLICSNRGFQELFELPVDMVRPGVGLEGIVRYNAERGLYGPGPVDEHVTARLEALVNEPEPFRLRLYPYDRVIEIRSARLPDGGIITTFADVTGQVEAEEALEATNETLEQRVRERTEELERLNRELAEAKAIADHANLSKTRFLAAASHDILQPLNAARLYATALSERLRDTVPSNEAGLARNVDASLEAVEEILTALLDISRLDAGAMKAEFSPFPIDDILGQLKIEFEPMAREKGLDLIFVPSTRIVRSDRRLLRRLMQNFISNAIKYTPKGRVLVGCRIKQGSDAQDSLCVQVWDTGLGIPQSKQRAVFREFERLGAATRAAPGLGLGLSIVERLGRVMGHKIGLSSHPGRGSVFSVTVPLAKTPPIAAKIEAALTSTPAHLPLTGLVVLVIDNEPHILSGMEALLSGWGCTIITGSHLTEAKAALSARKIVPHVVLADYHLDEGDGLETIVNLRWTFGADMPAVLITADRTPEISLAASQKNIKLLNKPVKPAALRAMLTQWRIAKGL